MPPPQLNTRRQYRESPNSNEPILIQLQDTKTEVRETRKELNARMDRLEQRQDRLKEKLEMTRREFNERIDKLDAKIDALHNEIKSSTGHISIANISTVGIALAVIYAVLK